MNRVFLALLILTPVALAGGWLGWSPLAVFLLSAAALIPLAKFIGDATEELAGHTNPAIGGLLNATFGNATELMVGLFALHAGLIEVVKASITGSIIGNLLFVLGTAMLLGGWKRERQNFNATAAKAAGSMLLLATIALVIPAIFGATSGAALPVEHLSVFVAVLLIAAYVAQLFFTLHTHKHLYQEESRVDALRWKLPTALLVLFAATVGAAVVSDTLVNSITPLVEQFGWSQLFIGVIVIAIVGNAAEHLSAVTVAIKDRMDLALQISIGSATQLVTFVAPVLVLLSLFYATPMNLVFSPFELVAIVFSVFVTNAVVEDGVSTWFEGFQLITAYIIMAVAFFFYV